MFFFLKSSTLQASILRSAAVSTAQAVCPSEDHNAYHMPLKARKNHAGTLTLQGKNESASGALNFLRYSRYEVP